MELDFHPAGIRDALLDRPAARYKPQSLNRERLLPGLWPPKERRISGI